MTSIFISGATGSLGTALCQSLMYDERYERVVCYSRGWLKQDELREKLGNHPKFRWFIGDVLDKERLLIALNGIDHVIHAAALKAIVSAEYNPSVALDVNVIGTENVLWASLNEGVKRVLFISTDKCVSALNFYGATKRVGEGLTIAYNSYSGGKGTLFSVARYANVVGSNGSVFQVFRKQAKSGKITITHPKMTRYWLTLEDAVQFVMACLDRMEGGEVFVPHLQSAPVTELADILAPEASKEIVGIRPGEKMHEVLLAPEEMDRTEDLGWAYRVSPMFKFWDKGDYQVSGSPVRDYTLFTSASAPRLTREQLQSMIEWAKER